ncbi:TM2 domain-containing protein [Frigoriflavimonas asaccharolytica]|uniref:TM2 domain-containing membrane protein YozV n=1 Tax=Frigoriflavimonas asaccharolytica TaxID=2735899 RepID=A0A8J8G6F2_9FLAO|nr:TM2 domain-containing protein [Frigoriflavimonas asaccharolytica]NRS92003.1 TM2 domain-containing membrane protein YozV [Frigoriflavimonas asaccharolytica]
MENFGYNQNENPNKNFSNYKSEKKIPAALLGILVGWLALNKFYLGYTKEGVIQLIANVFTCGIATIIPLVEGILYLMMSDKDFDDTYVIGKKPWL